MSITASWLVLAIVAVRFLFKKTPKWILCLLWGLVALRLICPFSIESALSLIPSAEPLPRDIIYTAHPEIHSGIPMVDDTVNPILESSMTPSELVSINPTQVWSFVFTQIWILGLVIMLAYALTSYLLLRRKVATAIPLRKNIKRCEFIDSPFVLGFFFPEIYLPAILEKKDWEYVIAHEEAHIARRDHWWKPIGFGLLSIYWFNPVLWLAYILLCRDIEAACDEKVIRNMDKNALRAYSTALLKSSIHQRAITACPLAFGEVGIRERIQNVMNYKKPSFWVILISLVLILALSATLLTNPEAKYDPEKVYPQSVLREPDRIYIDVSGTDRVFEKDSLVYKALLEVFQRNWWKYTEEDLETAADSLLISPIAPEVLKTKSWRTYVDISDTIICFRYTENPIVWENAEGEEICIQTIGFVLPEKTYSEDNTRGFFLISETEQIGINEGLYTYYYPPEIANDFWDFVNTANANEVRTYPGKTLTLNDVIILSQKGADLTLDDFAGFGYEEIGDPLLAVRTYPINDQWALLIHHGGGLEKPIAIWLTSLVTNKHIDITQGNASGAITEFIGAQQAEEDVYLWFDMYSSDPAARPRNSVHPILPGTQDVTLQGLFGDSIEISAAPGARYKTVISGQMIRNAYLADLTGDGISEICATVSDKSGIQVQIYDYAGDRLYVWNDPDGLSVVLTETADRLVVLKKEVPSGYTVGYGQLTLGEEGPVLRELDRDLLPLTQTVVCADILNRKQVCIRQTEQLQELLGLLEDLEGSAEPVSDAVLRQCQADSFDTCCVRICYGLGEKWIYFSADHSVVWEYGSHQGYSISDPGPIRQFVNSVTNGVMENTTSGEPFASMDAPWDWCAGIRSSAVKSAQLHVCLSTYSSGNVSGATSTNGVISFDTLQQLTDILNQIPQSAFMPGKILSGESYSGFFFNQSDKNTAISIVDGVNGLAVILSCRNGEVTMLLTNELEKTNRESFEYLKPTQLWTVKDPGLTAFFQSISENPPVISYSVGAEYQWQKPMDVTVGNFTLNLRLIEDWKAEYVTASGNSGIRCRPAEITDGWIYFSYWPKGYEPQEEERYYSEGGSRRYKTVTSYPASVKSETGVDLRHEVWSYRKVILDQGVYVIINDGADAWFLEYEDQIEDTITLADYSED